MQPYAFTGPGFFNLGINENWISSLKDLASQSTGNSDAPPALQWARRPITFSWENMVKWGFGLPLGILAWVGFLFMTWRILKRDWKPYLMIWVWTGVYFIYQSLQFSRTMRYQIYIYPTLVIMAAWLLSFLWDKSQLQTVSWKQMASKIGFWVLSVGVLLSTLTWAFAFVQIYLDPFTREEASEWIYQNVPTAINIQLESADGIFIQHVPYSLFEQIDVNNPFSIAFTPQHSLPVLSIQIDHILSLPPTDSEHMLVAEIRENTPGSSPILSGQLLQTYQSNNDPRGSRYQIAMNSLQSLSPDKEYLLTLRTTDPSYGLQLSGSIAIGYSQEQDILYQYLPEIVNSISAGEEYRKNFEPQSNSLFRGVSITHVLDYEGNTQVKSLTLQLLDKSDNGKVLVDLISDSSYRAESDPRGESIHFTVKDVISLQAGHDYELIFKNNSATGNLAFFGSKKADESSWDDVIPLNMYGYNAFDYFDGIYRTDLNFEMYWADNQEKRDRFYEILDQTDYIFITSNRQWGTTVRVPERYPLTIALYRSLIGCPIEKDIIWCYRVAQPGMFTSALGFELVEVFQSDPHIGKLLSLILNLLKKLSLSMIIPKF